MHLWNRQSLNNFSPLHAFSRAIALYYLVCLTLSYLSNWHSQRPIGTTETTYSYFLYLLLLAIAFIFYNGTSKRNRGTASIESPVALPQHFAWTVFAALAATFIFRLFFIHHTSLWLDELSELDLSVTKWPLGACAGQSQPPLSCILTFVGVKYVGFSEFGGRLHVVLASAFASVFFVLCLRGIVTSQLFILLYTLAFTTPAILIQYGYEVRPITLSIMHAMMVLAWLNSLLAKKPSGSDYFCLGAGGVLLLMSVGLQSAFALASIFLALTCLSLTGRTRRYFPLMAAIGGSFLIYLPIQLFIFAQVQTSVLPGFSLAPLPLFFNFLKNESWSYFTSQCGTFSYLFVALVALNVGAVALRLLVIKKQLDSYQSAVLERFAIYSLTTLFFYLILPPYFKTFITFGVLQYRYTLIGWPLIVLSIAAGVQLLLSFKAGVLRRAIPVFAFLLISTVLAANFGPTVIGWYYPNYRFVNLDQRTDLRGFYDWLRRSSSRNDFVVRACLRTENEFCSQNLNYPGAAVYYQNSSSSARLRPTDKPIEIYNLLSGNDEFQRLIIFFETNSVDKIQVDSSLLRGMSDIEYHNANGIPVLIFNGGRATLLKNWRIFLQRVDQISPGQSRDIAEYFLQLALIDKNRNSFVKYRELWRDIAVRTNSSTENLETYDRLMAETLGETR